MNKYAYILSRTIRTAIIALLVVAGVGAAYASISIYGDTIQREKMSAEQKLSADSGQIGNLQNQLDKSGKAEQRFSEIVAGRSNQDFSMNQDAFYTWLKTASSRFRVSSLKLTRSPETTSTKPELTNLNYKISLRQPMKIEFLAISDLHVFSFIDDLVHAAPGIIRVTSVQIKRRDDLKDDMLAIIKNGVAPLLVEAKIEFTWVGLDPKEHDSKTAPTSPTHHRSIKCSASGSHR